ncbi:MAG: GNAT family N-acetyltransferase [Candidatus Limnocylindrales bacterium]
MRVLVGHDDGARGRLQRIFALELGDSARLSALGAEIDGRLVGVLTFVDSPGCTSRSAAQLLGFVRVAGPRVVRAVRMVGRIERAHPRSPHRHLPSVGVSPAWQAQGVGTALMDAFHERCDAMGRRPTSRPSAGPIPPGRYTSASTGASTTPSAMSCP